MAQVSITPVGISGNKLQWHQLLSDRKTRQQEPEIPILDWILLQLQSEKVSLQPSRHWGSNSPKTNATLIIQTLTITLNFRHHPWRLNPAVLVK